ncbi:MAG: hypothetical protein JO115_21505 [Pseudonocardiales bacterium]|nr:hypothetical protein [Pseudonocardiales bacterium]
MTNPGSSQPDGPSETPPQCELRVVVHLLAVDGLGYEGGVRLPRVYWTLCGEVVSDADLPHAVCPQECDWDLSYCPACLRSATGRNAETDADVVAAGRGIVGEEPSSPSRTDDPAALRWLGAGSAVMSGKHCKPLWWRLGALWRRLCGRGRQVSPPPVHLNPLVDGYDGLVHLITDGSFEQGLRERTGRYSVLCGLTINVASMVTPPGRSCERCHVLGGRA